MDNKPSLFTWKPQIYTGSCMRNLIAIIICIPQGQNGERYILYDVQLHARMITINKSSGFANRYVTNVAPYKVQQCFAFIVSAQYDIGCPQGNKENDRKKCGYTGHLTPVNKVMASDLVGKPHIIYKHLKSNYNTWGLIYQTHSNMKY